MKRADIFRAIWCALLAALMLAPILFASVMQVQS